MTRANPIFCAIDSSDLEAAHRLGISLKSHVGGLKLGLEFFLAHGAAGYRRMAEIGLPIFLDLKLHDIPNTVAGAVASLLPLQPAFMTLHAGGGAAMMRAATEAVSAVAVATDAQVSGAEQSRLDKNNRPKLLGVTVLTSLDKDDLTAVGQGANPAAQVLRLARLAKDSGLDGVICSPEEVKNLREALGPDFILMVPGIRPSWAAANDQKRVMTPSEAMLAGANYLVIGRPITASTDPAQAAQRINEELSAGAEQARP